MNRENTTAAQEWKRNWPMIIAATIGFSFFSIMPNFIGIYMEPVSNEFGWSRTQMTAGVSLASILTTIAAPFFGVLIDRWGTRRLAIPGILIQSLVVASFGLISGSLTNWIVMWVIYAFGSLAMKSTTWTVAVAGVFTKGRGLALGVVMSGSALTQIIVPPLGNWLIAEYGWRASFAWLGFGWGGIALVLCLLFLYDAHDHMRQARAASPGENLRTVRLPGLTIAEAWRSQALWRIAISTVITMLVTAALLVHQFPILLEAGVSRERAALLASLAGIAGLLGKLITGSLLDRFTPNWVGGLTLSAGAIAFVLLLEPIRTPLLIVLAIIINGYTSGSKLQVCSYLTSRYAGMKNFGTIFGFMASLIALGSGLGPVLGGVSYDLYGNYTLFLIIGIIGSLISGLMIFGLGRYPEWEGEISQSK